MPPPRKGKAEKLSSKTTSNVSPGQSMAMTGDTSLAGLSQEAASDAVKAGKQNLKGTKYGGKLADFMAKKNIEIAQNQAKVQRDLLADPSKAGFKGFLPKGLGQGIQKFGQGIMQNLTPARMIASGIGSLLFGPIGGVLAGLLANRATTDAFKKDVGDTIDFGKLLAGNLKTDFSNILGNPVPVFGGTTEEGEVDDVGVTNLGVNEFGNEMFSMPAPSGLAGTTVYGNMPRVTSAPIGRVTSPINAVDLFGNPVVSDAYNIDPMIQTQSLASPTTMDILGAEGLLNTPVIDEGTTMRSPVFDEGVGPFDKFNMPVLEPSPDFDPQGSGIITPFDLQYFNYMGKQPTVV